MNILITYDVSTETAAGRRRLRKVALACLDFGQRVQKSVFECSVSEMQYEEVMRRLLEIIEEKEDSLRVYRLIEPKEKYVQVYGVNTAVDFEEPLVL
ncbi:MAG: CRISPR-associated endonuclease Cas2 [Nitrospira sp.]|nr:CRISPR-associated endonuclease Cas2 [Nitrospira sp.]MDF0667218.1 CRISPR-associated endonuclease Cas2 [Nitrospira sp.]